MSVAEDGQKIVDRPYLEEGIARLEEENKELPTPENEEAIRMAEKELGE